MAGSKHIVLISDFGVGSPYVAEMKGAILSVCSQAQIVDGTHSVPPQDILHGAQVTRQLATAFPKGTVFVVVVDPGVGSERRLLLVEHQNRLFIGPNNGVLSLLFHEDAAIRVLDKPCYWRATISSTFHGRDIMGPTAGHLAQGVPTSEVASPFLDFPHRCELPKPQVSDREVIGEIVFIDGFGNLVSNISIENLNLGSVVECSGKRLSVVKTYAAREDGAAIALVGSQGYLEIAVVNGSAAQHLNVQVGTSVRVFIE